MDEFVYFAVVTAGIMLAVTILICVLLVFGMRWLITVSGNGGD